MKITPELIENWSIEYAMNLQTLETVWVGKEILSEYNKTAFENLQRVIIANPEPVSKTEGFMTGGSVLLRMLDNDQGVILEYRDNQGALHLKVVE